MDTLARSYKYRLYPTPNQERMLEAWQAACLDVQRVCIIQRRAAWNLYKISRVGSLPSWASQGREVTGLRADYPHLADVPSDTLSAVVKRVDEAYKRMREDMKAGKRAKVRWADKSSQIGLTFRGGDRGTRLEHQKERFGWWRLSSASKLGVLKVRMHRAMPEGTTIKQAHITRAADGWYISFSCVIPIPALLPAAEKSINGVDLGCIHEGDNQRVAVVDDGRIYTVTDELKRSHARLQTMQRLVDPKRKVAGKAKAADPSSKRTAKRREKIARQHQKVARQREHNQQYIARRLVDTANTTAFEDVKWGNLRKKSKPVQPGPEGEPGPGSYRKGSRRAKKGLNRAMATASPSRLVALTQEKAAAAGRAVVKVNARNTSQACSACGVIGERKKLSVRAWTCEACGAVHDRDVNAAQNVALRARNLSR